MSNKIKEKYTFFYNNGVRKAKGEYLENIRDGVYKKYYISGNTEIEGNYKLGKKDGEWVFYSEDGSIIKTILYEDGEIVEEIIYQEEIIILEE